jgi:hypothetical protein
VFRRTAPVPYGDKAILHIDEIKPKKKKKGDKLHYGQVGMLQIGEAFTEPVGRKEDNLWKLKDKGKIGVWRTVRGNRYFYPDDGSGPIPPMRGVKDKGKADAKAAFKGKSPAEISGEVRAAELEMEKAFPAGAEGDEGGKEPAKKKGAQKGAEKPSGGDDDDSNIPNRDSLMDKVMDMLEYASGKKGAGALKGALNQMLAALKKDDPKAFVKASAALKKAVKKLKKKKKKREKKAER